MSSKACAELSLRRAKPSSYDDASGIRATARLKKNTYSSNIMATAGLNIWPTTRV